MIIKVYNFHYLSTIALLVEYHEREHLQYGPYNQYTILYVIVPIATAESFNVNVSKVMYKWKASAE